MFLLVSAVVLLVDCWTGKKRKGKNWRLLPRKGKIPFSLNNSHSIKNNMGLSGFSVYSAEGLLHSNEDRYVAMLSTTVHEMVLGESDNDNNKDASSTPLCCSYFAVYDGHGGSLAVDLVLQRLHKNIINKDTKHLFSPSSAEEIDEKRYIPPPPNTNFLYGSQQIMLLPSCAG